MYRYARIWLIEGNGSVFRRNRKFLRSTKERYITQSLILRMVLIALVELCVMMLILICH